MPDLEYTQALAAVAQLDASLAETISGHVSALRTECAACRIERSELHALLSGITGGHNGRA